MSFQLYTAVAHDETRGARDLARYDALKDAGSIISYANGEWWVMAGRPGARLRPAQ